MILLTDKESWKRAPKCEPTLLWEQGRIEEAIGWYTQAADAGSRTAQYHLGKLYLQGEVISKDVTKAMEYLTAAAEQGNQYAQ